MAALTKRSLFYTYIVCLVLVVQIPVSVYAQQGPGAAFFSYKCGSSSISFFMHGTPVLQASFSEITSPLSSALSTNQNQLIKSAADVALWALKSDELQIHQTKDPDLTRYVLPSTICGPLYAVPTTTVGSAVSSQALAMVQINGAGQGIAIAQVDANGIVSAFAAVSGNGVAFAAAQSSNPDSNTGTPNTSGHYHVVAKGENLFRIALKYGTTVTILAQLNNIADPTHIYVGQKIYLP